jgi:3'(2'), 5'-bisphosphate nucleotidase
MIKDIKKIIREAGKIALFHQSRLTIDSKEDKSIVTNGDVAVSKFLEKELSIWYPVLSEENYNDCKEDIVFIVDPIDGTLSYSKKEDSWSVMISLVDKNEPVLGFIYQPTKDILFYTEDGSSYKDEKGVISKLPKCNDDNLTAVISKNEKDNSGYMSKLLRISPTIENFEYTYGAGLKICHVAEGKSSIYLSTAQKCSIWDLMAGWAILRLCGGNIYFEKNYSLDRTKPLVSSNFYCSKFNLNEDEL